MINDQEVVTAGIVWNQLEPVRQVLAFDGRYFVYDYYYVPKHNYYILLYIIIITL